MIPEEIREKHTSYNTAKISEAIKNSSTPYGDLTVVDRDNRIDVSTENPLSGQQDYYTAGVTHDAVNSRYRIRANAGTESLETIDSLQYTPGYIAEIGFSLQIPQAPSGGQEVRWGYWDGTDGVYYGWDANGVFIERLRGGTRVGKTYEENWSVSSEIDAHSELQDGTITIIDLALYNYGTIGFELFEHSDKTDELRSEKVHSENVEGTTTLSKQDNPLRVVGADYLL